MQAPGSPSLRDGLPGSPALGRITSTRAFADYPDFEAGWREHIELLVLLGKGQEAAAVKARAATIRAMERGALDPASDLDIVRGIEGQGTRVYYEGFPRLVRNPGFSFKGRNRRPPLDPVNALLSFVYTLLTSEVLTAIKIVGLDPYMGALHVEDYGRPSLACDLVEEWRVFLGDRFVLALINRNVLSPEDFVYRQIENTDFVDEEDLKQKRPVEMKPATSALGCENRLTLNAKWYNLTL